MRKLVVLLSLLTVFVVACTGGGNGADERQGEAVDEQGPAVVVPTSAAEPTALPGPTVEPPSDGDALGGFLNPLSLLSSPLLSGAGPTGLPSATGEADPSLKAALLTLEDLPVGYSELVPGGMSFSMETGEGIMDMAASMFSEGGAADTFPESMVMSAVMAGSGDLLDQSLGELQRYTGSGDLEREIQEAMGPSDMMGVHFDDVRVLDASGLGEGGFGLHMVMTMDMEEWGVPVPPDAQFLREGMAFDMYVFLRGDHVLMVMSMWPGSGPAPVDAAGLAEVMDGRAGGAF